MNIKKPLFIIVGLLFCYSTQAQVSINTEYLCSGDGDTSSFLGTYTGSKEFIMFKWHYGDGVTTSGLENPSSKIHKYESPGIYNLKLIVRSYDSVLTAFVYDSTVRIITVYPEPIYDFVFSGDTTFYEDKEVTLTVEDNNNVLDSIFWSTGVTQNKSITVNTQNVYKVIGQGVHGCKTDKSVTVTVLDINELIPVTVITPNADGKNDKWFINEVGGYGFISVVVFNKYGEEVYSNETYANDWEGTYDGKELPAGAYYYIIKTNKEKVYKGSVNILK